MRRNQNNVTMLLAMMFLSIHWIYVNVMHESVLPRRRGAFALLDLLGTSFAFPFFEQSSPTRKCI